MAFVWLSYLCLASLVAGIASASSCPREKLPCDNGTCIERSKWCDDISDCPDESDEEYCRFKGWWDNDPNFCKGTHFLCSDGRCFPLVAKCDGIQDCKDGSDEEKCEYESSATQYSDLRNLPRISRPTSGDTVTPATPRRTPGVRLPTRRPSGRTQDTNLDHQPTSESGQSPKEPFKPRVSQDTRGKEKDSRILSVLNGRPDPQNTSEDTQTPDTWHRRIQKGKALDLVHEDPSTPCPRPAMCPEEEITPCPQHPLCPTPCPQHPPCPTPCPKHPCPTPCPKHPPCATPCPQHPCPTPCPYHPPCPTSSKCPGEEDITPSPTPFPRRAKCTEEEEINPSPTPCPRREEEEEEEINPSPTPCPRREEEEEEEEINPSPTPCPPEEDITPCPSHTPCPRPSRCPGEEEPCPTPCPGRVNCPEGGGKAPSNRNPFGPTKCPVVKGDDTKIDCPTGANPQKPTGCESTPTPEILTPPLPLTRRPIVLTRRVSTSESLRKARKWLLDNWTASHYGWGKDTPRVLVALSLSEDTRFYNERKDNSRMKKQLQVLLAVDVLRNNTKVISLSTLSLYINAMLASCQNPRDFHGIDLVAILRKRTDAAAHSRDCPDEKNCVPVNPLTYLTLCLANETSYVDVNIVENFLEPRSTEHKWLDMQALAIMAYSCMLKNPDLSSPRRQLLDASVNALVNRMEDDGSFGSIYSTALAVQALTATYPIRNWNPEKSVKFLQYHQHPDGSFGDVLATYYIIPVLARKCLADLQNVICPKTDEELTLESLRNSKLPMHYIRYSLYFGKPIQTADSKSLRVPVGSNFFQIMKLAAEMDVKFRFEHEKEGEDITVYAISNVPNDAERGMEWKLYLNPNRQVAFENGSPVTHLQSYDRGVQYLIPEAGDHIVFWYQPYLKRFGPPKSARNFCRLLGETGFV